eukprot:scaffold508_cov554-Prasinococcus_capsulatus_cf.AAC.24
MIIRRRLPQGGVLASAGPRMRGEAHGLRGRAGHIYNTGGKPIYPQDSAWRGYRWPPHGDALKRPCSGRQPSSGTMACRVGVPALDVAPHRIAARCRYGANRTATQVIPSTGGPQLLVARRNSYLLSAKHTITHTSCRASKKRPLHSFTHNVRSGFVPKLLPRGRQLGTSFSGRNVRGRAHADESSKDDSIPPGTVEKALRELSVLLLFTGFTGAAITFARGAESGTQFFAGFLLEESLSVDNLLVFVLIFSYFKTPVALNEIVLKYGLYGAAVLRAARDRVEQPHNSAAVYAMPSSLTAIFILLGAAILSKFRGVMLVFAVILLYSAYGILAGDEEEEDLSQNNIVKFAQNFISVSPQYDGNKFFTMVDSVVMATPLFLTVAVIELSDLVFAVDSIPAVFGITTVSVTREASQAFGVVQATRAAVMALTSSEYSTH